MSKSARRPSENAKAAPAAAADAAQAALASGTAAVPAEGTAPTLTAPTNNETTTGETTKNAQAVPAELASVSSPLAAPAPQTIEATTREMLFGTIGLWGKAGVAEIERVSGELQAHSWSEAELTEIRSALDALAGAVAAAIDVLAAPVDAVEIMEANGLSASDILAFDPATGTVVTRSGHKVRRP